MRDWTKYLLRAGLSLALAFDDQTWEKGGIPKPAERPAFDAVG